MLYLHRARMLPLARVVCAGLPVMDAPLLTAFVDRWRPETHSFHLPCGEVSISMQDVAMILGLPLEGNAVIGMIQTDGWRDMVRHTLGFDLQNHLRESRTGRPQGLARLG